MEKDLKIVKIKTEYCDYLRKFDNRVPYNFHSKENRPFLGVLFEIENCKYFAPLSSPKPKHLTMNNTIDFLKLNEGKLGAINFNNMLPVMEENIIDLDLNMDVNSKSDKDYQKLLKKQIFWLNRHKESVYRGSRQLYSLYIKGELSKRVYDRCCNFKLLEEKCVQYNSVYS